MTHPEHDEEQESLVRWIADRAQAFAEDKPVATFPVDEVRKRIAAHTAKAVEEAESRLMAKMQSEIVSPAIDDDFGTYDYKMVAENALNFIEKRLSTPTLKGRQPHDPAI